MPPATVCLVWATVAVLIGSRAVAQTDGEDPDPLHGTVNLHAVYYLPHACCHLLANINFGVLCFPATKVFGELFSNGRRRAGLSS